MFISYSPPPPSSSFSLPRYPFLLVDKVIDIKAGEYAVGVKNVTINDNFFPGHFPERAIMPGVLQVEALAQVRGRTKKEKNKEKKREKLRKDGGIALIGLDFVCTHFIHALLLSSSFSSLFVSRRWEVC